MGDTLLGEKGSVKMERIEEVKRKKKEVKGSRFGNRYGFELKLRCVKLRLEEGLPVSLLSKEVGVSKDVVYRWVRAYQERGEEGLRNPVRSSGSRRKLPGPVRKKIEVVNETTLSAGKRLMEVGCHPVLLNFASATSPGGGFLKGARAQEEYLARSSCLYSCIRSNAMYAFHCANYDPLYTDYAIYSPGVPVIRDDSGTLLEVPYTIAMITCAAVNVSRLPAQRRHEIGPAMMRRISKVLSVGIAHGHDGIVLGAWGSGAFRNDGYEIVGLFYNALSNKFKGAYRRVIFAVVDWSPDRRFIGPFEEQFQSKVRAGAPAAAHKP